MTDEGALRVSERARSFVRSFVCSFVRSFGGAITTTNELSLSLFNSSPPRSFTSRLPLPSVLLFVRSFVGSFELFVGSLVLLFVCSFVGGPPVRVAVSWQNI